MKINSNPGQATANKFHIKVKRPEIEPKDELGGQVQSHPDMKKIEALRDLVSQKADRIMAHDESEKDALKGEPGVVAFSEAKYEKPPTYVVTHPRTEELVEMRALEVKSVNDEKKEMVVEMTSYYRMETGGDEAIGMSNLTLKTDYSKNPKGVIIRTGEEGGYVPGEGLKYKKEVNTEEMDVSYEEFKKEMSESGKNVDNFLG